MLERFLKLKSCVLKALIDLDTNSELNKNDFNQLNEIVNALLLIQSTVEILCRRDINLVKADAVFEVLLKHLERIFQTPCICT